MSFFVESLVLFGIGLLVGGSVFAALLHFAHPTKATEKAQVRSR